LPANVALDLGIVDVEHHELAQAVDVPRIVRIWRAQANADQLLDILVAA